MPENLPKKSILPERVAGLLACYSIAVPISIAIALETYAEEHRIKPETAILEAVRAYMGEG